MRTVSAYRFRPTTAAARNLPIFGDYAARWALIAASALFAAGWLAALHIGFDIKALYPKLGFSILVIALAGLYHVLALRLPRLGRPVAVVNDLLLSLVQLLALISAFLPLTYLAATTNFPLLDARLSAIDAAWFGFDWDAVSAWIAVHPLLDRAQQWVYGTIYWQGAVVLMIGSITRTGERNSESLWLFAVSLIITIAVFCFTPALGRLGRSGDEQLVAIQAIRSGQFSVFSYSQAAGIIGFPSFHAALAVILTYCVRRQMPILALIAPLNLFMLTAIPTVGGHYLIDIAAGIVVAGISILLVRRVRSEVFGFTPPGGPVISATIRQ